MTGTQIFFVAAIFFAGAIKINGFSNQGRLLTPEEGCGIQPLSKMFLMQHHASWPWMGSLLAYFPDARTLESNCSATLISSRHALTSANCVSVTSNYPYFIRLGETPKEEPNSFEDYIVSKWLVHPKSKATELKNNIAILVLAKEVEFSDRIRPACLPPRASILKERISEIYRLVREDSFQSLKASAYKPKSYKQVETEFCQLIHSVKLSDQTAFCAQADVISGNQGDPFVVKIKGKNGTTPIYQIGLDAIHMRRLNPGIFLNLQPYVQWINDTINGNQ